MKRKQTGSFIVTGPGIDRDGLPSAHVALTFAQGKACELKEDATIYVRDLFGKVIYRVERDQAARTVTTYWGGET